MKHADKNLTKQDACAHNNALWCDAVLRAAGTKTRFCPGYWQASGGALPLYPDIVTTGSRPGTGLETALLDLPKNAAVKDSFDCLDLATVGFRKLFSATWFFREPRTDRRPEIRSDWHKITHRDALDKWKAAWSSDPAHHSALCAALLEDASVEFAAIGSNGDLRAGGVINKGPKIGNTELIGLGNVFCRKSWRYSALQALLAPYEHRPVCTYEVEEDVFPVYRQLGFEPCGGLSVWQKI